MSSRFATSMVSPNRPRIRTRPWLAGAIVFGLLTPQSAFSIQVEAGDPGYILPPAGVQEIFSTDKNFATLDHVSPDGRYFAVPHVTELSSLDKVAEPTLRLAMLELRADVDRPWHLDLYGLDGLRLYSMDEKRFHEVDLPDAALISDLMWAPDGERIAFFVHLPERTEVWTADPSSGSARRMASQHATTAIGSDSRGQGSAPSRMLQWTPEGGILTLVPVENRGLAPSAARSTGPVIRKTRKDESPNPTYPFLLRTERDADLFEYHTTSQIAEIDSRGRTHRIGPPGMYESISLSPDGTHILATRIVRPFSYIAPYSNFPRVTEVLTRTGEVVAVLEEQELRERRVDDDSGDDGPRDWAWRPATGQIAYLHHEARDTAAAGEDEESEDPLDRIMVLSAPFDTAGATVLATSAHPIGDLVFAANGAHAFGTLRKDEKQAAAHWNVGENPAPEPHRLTDWYDGDLPLEFPGEIWTAWAPNGLEVAYTDNNGTHAFLEGPGYAEDLKPTPFVDRVALAGDDRQRIFEGAKDSFDQPLVLLDADAGTLIVSREGVHDFPDSFLWSAGSFENLTNNVDPFPEITAAQRVDFSFERRDGLEVRGRISLPPDYEEGTRVPAIFWTYPREFRSKEAFESETVRSRNLNAHTQMSWLRWSDIWLSQGYALVYPDIPIVGEDYNDYYISNMVDGMYAAVREVDRLGYVDIDRIGHGGHSYGAFATANFLAHTPFFKAGIAGNGAYNRTLTPQGFQAEPRNIWEAPDVYIEMSPFFKADQINTPLLMYHGAADNNTGTFPIQSERLMQALQGLGKDAVLYLYPYESHTPRALEHNLDMWARWIAWFDRYVKGGSGEPMVGAR